MLFSEIKLPETLDKLPESKCGFDSYGVLKARTESGCCCNEYDKVPDNKYGSNRYLGVFNIVSVTSLQRSSKNHYNPTSLLFFNFTLSLPLLISPHGLDSEFCLFLFFCSVMANVVEVKVGLHCDDCIKKILKAIKKIEDIETYNVDTAMNKVIVTGKVTTQQVIRVLQKIGKNAIAWEDVSLMTIVSQLMVRCLTPLGQSTLVSQMLGGLMFGPSVLGHKKILGQALFPVRGAVVLETISWFGVMFSYFLWSVKMDISTFFKTEKLAIALGSSVFVCTLVIPTGVAYLLAKHVEMKQSVATALPLIGLSQSFTVFVTIAILLSDLKVLNTDIGRITMGASVLTNMASFVVIIIMFIISQNVDGDMVKLVIVCLSIVSLVVVIVFMIRPMILWMVEHSGRGSLNEICVVHIFVFVLFTGFVSEVIGQHFAMGPIILGLCLPEGPPIGTSLMTKLETICMAFLNPIFLAVNGLQADISKIDFHSMWLICLVLIVAFFVKIGAVMLPGYYYNLPMKECCVIGLLLNGRGTCELVLYNLWLGSRQVTEREFSLLVVTIIVENIFSVPLIKFMYDPSKQYQTGRRCTIQHTRRDSELRVMVCIDSSENLPTILNLLEASCASRESMIEVTSLILIELQGRLRPVLVNNKSSDNIHPLSGNSIHIDNALRQYAEQNEGYVSIQSFTSISTFETMHDDVCRISLECGANILILPFHKRWEIDGTIGAEHKSIQNMNIRVLERAPCSVGILVDRGILNDSPSLLMARGMYYVVVFFIGGADDAETLAYGNRMARHECVYVTVVRFLLFGEENSKDRKRDSDLIDEYRYHNAGNRRFEILDEVVKDGIEMSTCVRRLVDYFDLVMVGREHPDSVMLRGHDKWSECHELGVIGDMLASPDFVTKASVLVIQQQRIRGRFIKSTVNVNAVPREREQLMHEVPIVETFPPSCTISVDKYDKM
ncbi:unnamed protein product [Sphenostylis stenocarpa]|uniref:HMA domain-containing protein n=1 Tax=Sphenostylis stenocarpa TaxID=92480 RepID=A0AA86S281_9FABA|nr:unnamed protein product [Sphenostylis stenocarpa]